MNQMEQLNSYLKEKEKLIVAFSGGVDSTFLLKVAHDVLGNQVIAATAKSASFPERELREAVEFCKKEQIRHIIFEFEELEIEGFAHNPPNRCYICKKELFLKIRKIAAENGISHIAEASNLDDNDDYRPGLMAVGELGILSPLRAVGMDKSTIRSLSKELGLSTWNKPSFACLASRFVYGEEITAEKLRMADRAEQFLLDEGFHQVRVRLHGNIARIEIGQDEFDKLLTDSMPQRIHERLKKIGFAYVTLDLGGYRMGSMNDSCSLAGD